MMIRSLALALVLGGCVVHTHETPGSSLTSTTRSTSATSATTPVAYDPHFRVSNQIYESCQLSNRTDLDVAQGTALCMKTGVLSDKRVRIRGDRSEAENARTRLVGSGVDVNRIVVDYTDGPAVIDVVDNTLGKWNRGNR